jgi:hypothetical protein
MVIKCVRKLILVMIELLILILLSLQANDCAPISFFPSPPPIVPPYSFELDGYGSLYACLRTGVEFRCASIKSTWPFPDIEYETCIFVTFEYCLGNFENYKLQNIVHVIKYCIKTNFHPKLKIKASHRRSARYVSCLLECYEDHIKNPSDVIYTQNP